MRHLRTQLQSVGIIGCVLVVVFGLLPSALLREPGVTLSQVETEDSAEKHLDGRVAGCASLKRCRERLLWPILEPFRGVLSMSNLVFSIFRVQFFTFAAWFSFKMFSSEWMATSVFHGKVDAPIGSVELERYGEGVRWANRALMAMSGVFVAASVFVPLLAHKYGYGIVWGACLALLAATYFVMSTVSLTPWLALLLVATLGVPYSSAFSLPWTMVTQAAKASGGGAGRVTAAFNLSQATPSLFIATSSGPLIAFLGGDTSVLPVLFFGGVCASVAAALTALVDTKATEQVYNVVVEKKVTNVIATKLAAVVGKVSSTEHL